MILSVGTSIAFLVLLLLLLLLLLLYYCCWQWEQ
jgi:hypothetical protein